MRVLPGIILSVVLAVSWNCNDAYASPKDKDIRELLDSPGVVEKFKKTQGKEVKNPKDNESPLVKEAKSFALYLNPPQKVEKRPTKVDTRTKSIVKAPTNVSAKFKLVGTSYAESDPSTSLALLDIAGKGLRWIRQGESVGHMVIEEVKPGGTIVVRDGKNTSEMTTDKPVKISLLKGEQPDMTALSGQIESMLSASSDSGSRIPNGVKPSASNKLRERPKLSEEEMKQQELMMEQLMEQVGQMLKAAGDEANSPGGKDVNGVKSQELMSNELMKQMDQMFNASVDDANSTGIPGEIKLPAKDEVNEKQEVEKPQTETLDVGTVEEASELMGKLSEKLEQIESNTDSADVESIEKDVQQDADFLRKAILTLRKTDVSPEEKSELIALDKELAKVQQDIRRSQSRKRIESAKGRSRR